MANYTDANKISEYLQRSLTSYEQALLSVFLPAIKIWLDKKLNSTFDSVAASTQYYDGGEQSLDIDPCSSITAVKSLNTDGSTSYDYDLTTTPDVLFEPKNETIKREIRKRIGCFPSGVQNIAVSATFSEYDSGIPQDIQIVATRIAADVIEASKQSTVADVASESLEGHSITYKKADETIDKVAMNDPLVLSMLEQRREILV